MEHRLAPIGLIALLLGVGGGCPRPGPAKPPRLTLDKARLTGPWMGVARDQPAPGEHRVVRVLCQLRAHPDTGRLTGSLEYRGAISTAYQGRLACNDKARARWNRTAAIAHGRLLGHQATWTLGDPQQDGDAGCAARFPLARQCTVRPRPAGRLALRCGGAEVTLEHVALTGVWAWDEERTDRAGDTQIKRQRFHLVQQGSTLRGFVDDIRVHISRDGQRYRCNGRLRYSRQSRHHLEGSLKGLTVELRVTRSVPSVGPCQGSLELPARLDGTWRPFEDRLELPLQEGGRKLRRLPGLLPVGAAAPPPR